ncbi:MAG: helix-turn-helix transcriptional regulator [Bacteroidales bacterium]|nr:helix-turn-helix transcriptional regulator [Bacteroidales bacterium]
MKKNALEFLESHQSTTPSKFEEEARWRQENEIWLRLSRSIALTLVDYMQKNQLSRADMAKELAVSTQYLSRILSGTENFSLKSIAHIEAVTGIQCFTPTFA